jgi:hypothetical protein
MKFIATKEIIIERLQTCAQCEFIKKGLIHRCDACGCAIKAKVILDKSACPKNKWRA